MKTCSECGGTGRCFHCHGTGVVAPVFWHEGSRGPGEGLRCSYCGPGGSGVCSSCQGAGSISSEEDPKHGSEIRGERPLKNPAASRTVH